MCRVIKSSGLHYKEINGILREGIFAFPILMNNTFGETRGKTLIHSREAKCGEGIR